MVALDQELAARNRPHSAEEPQQGRAGGSRGADRDMAAALLSERMPVSTLAPERPVRRGPIGPG